MASTDGHDTTAEGNDMTTSVDLGLAHLRVARPTDDLGAVVRFYCDGLGLDELASDESAADGDAKPAKPARPARVEKTPA